MLLCWTLLSISHNCVGRSRLDMLSAKPISRSASGTRPFCAATRPSRRAATGLIGWRTSDRAAKSRTWFLTAPIEWFNRSKSPVLAFASALDGLKKRAIAGAGRAKIRSAVAAVTNQPTSSAPSTIEAGRINGRTCDKSLTLYLLTRALPGLA